MDQSWLPGSKASHVCCTCRRKYNTTTPFIFMIACILQEYTILCIPTQHVSELRHSAPNVPAVAIQCKALIQYRCLQLAKCLPDTQAAHTNPTQSRMPYRMPYTRMPYRECHTYGILFNCVWHSYGILPVWHSQCMAFCMAFWFIDRLTKHFLRTQSWYDILYDILTVWWYELHASSKR